MRIRHYLVAAFASILLAQGVKAQGIFNEVSYTKQATTFCLNAPSKPVLRLYKDGQKGKAYKKVKMKEIGKDKWSATVNGNLRGIFYTFDIGKGETPGVFAKAVGVNGKRGAVVAMKETNPTGWETDQRVPTKSFADIVIYEMHHRDFSIDPSSGLVPVSYTPLQLPTNRAV